MNPEAALAGRPAIEAARILAQALMSHTAKSLNYVVALSMIGDRAPEGSWTKITGEFGDWYVRVDRDGIEYRGASRPDAPPEGVKAEIVVPSGVEPVTDGLKSFLATVHQRPTAVLDQPTFTVHGPSFLSAPYDGVVAMLARTVEAASPQHRSRLVSEVLGVFKSPEPEASILSRLSALETWIASEHKQYACDSFVPALMALMVATLTRTEDAVKSIGQFMKFEMFTSVGIVRDRFLSAPPLRARPKVLLDAAVDLMKMADQAIDRAQGSQDLTDMFQLLYDAIPKCVAARWLFFWAKDSPLNEVAASALAQWNRTDETLVRLRTAFVHQVFDLDGGGWKRLMLNVERVRKELGHQAASKFARRHIGRHLLYPLAFASNLE